MNRRRIGVDDFPYAVCHVNIREVVSGYSLLIQKLMNIRGPRTISLQFYANMEPKSIKHVSVQQLEDG